MSYVVVTYDEIIPTVGSEVDKIAVDPDTTVYGPYTMAEAQAVAERIDGDDLKAQILPLDPWPGYPEQPKGQ